MPSRIIDIKSDRAFRKSVQKSFRLVNISDESSFYRRFGAFGLRPLNKNHDLLPAMKEYEIHCKRSGHWREIPPRKHYERIFFEAHGPTHAGTTTSEENLTARFWFPHIRNYLLSFISSCAVCDTKRPSVKNFRKPASVIMYEEFPLDRL